MAQGAIKAPGQKTGAISIIIVSWNACQLLRKCLMSIRACGDSAIREIIVVDNASTDGSQAMVEGEFPDVTLLRCAENLGFSKANNLGISQASGDLLALVNSDIIVEPGTFTKLANALQNDPKTGLVGPKVQSPDGELQSTYRRLPTVWTIVCRVLALDRLLPHLPLFSGWQAQPAKQSTPTPVDVLSGCFWMARRDAVAEVGNLDERFFFYAEDTDWCKRFKNSNWQVVFVPTANVVHYGAGSSANAPLRYSVEILRANMAYWRKHHGPIGQSIYYLLCILHHGLRFLARGLMKIFGLGRTPDEKFQEDVVCLRWLLTGRRL